MRSSRWRRHVRKRKKENPAARCATGRPDRAQFLWTHKAARAGAGRERQAHGAAKRMQWRGCGVRLWMGYQLEAGCFCAMSMRNSRPVALTAWLLPAALCVPLLAPFVVTNVGPPTVLWRALIGTAMARRVFAALLAAALATAAVAQCVQESSGKYFDLRKANNGKCVAANSWRGVTTCSVPCSQPSLPPGPGSLRSQRCHRPDGRL